MEKQIAKAKRAFAAGDFEAGFRYYELLRRAGLTDPSISHDEFRKITRDEDLFAPAESEIGPPRRVPTPKSIKLIPWLFHLILLGYETDDERYQFVVAAASNTLGNIVKAFPTMATSPALQEIVLQILQRDLPFMEALPNRTTAMLNIVSLVSNQTFLHEVSRLYPKCQTSFIQRALMRHLYHYHKIFDLVEDQFNINSYNAIETSLQTLAKIAEYSDLDFDANYWVELILKRGYDLDSATTIYTLQQFIMYRNIDATLQQSIINAILEVMHSSTLHQFDFQAACNFFAAIGYVEALPHMQAVLAQATHPDNLPPAHGFASGMGRGASIRAYRILERAIAQLEEQA